MHKYAIIITFKAETDEESERVFDSIEMRPPNGVIPQMTLRKVAKSDIMPKYNVTYTIIQSRVFDVPDKSYIEAVLNESSGCRIVSIDLVEEVNGDNNE